MKAIKIFFKSSSLLFQIIFFALSVGLILLVAYFLGYGYLQAIKGNDSMYHLTNIFWFDRFFPKIPYWYPLQNGGVVPIWGYPFLSYGLVILIHRLSSISLISAFQILGFLSVPLTSIGLYLFIWTRLKKQFVALIASILYMLAPITWVWLYDWGFYTENVSYIFFFPTLIFFDIFVEDFLAGKLNIWSRLSFAGGVMFLALAFLTHPTLFFVLAATLFGYGLSKIVKHRKPGILPNLLNAALPSIIIVVSTVMLLAFYIIDFNAYAKMVSPVTSPGQRQEFETNYPTPVNSLLGLYKIPPTEFKYVHRNIVVPPVVWVPGIFGIVASVFLSPEILILSFLATLPVIMFTWPVIAFKLPMFFWLLGYIVSHRAILIFIRMLAPIAAAMGIWAVFRLPLGAATFWIKGKISGPVKTAIISLIAGVCSLALAAYLIVYGANKPDTLWDKTQVRYGPVVFDVRNLFSESLPQDICGLTADNPGRPKSCDQVFVKTNLDMEKVFSYCGNEAKNKAPVCGGVINGTVGKEDFNKFLNDCDSAQNYDLCKAVKKVDSKELIKFLSDRDKWPKPKLGQGFAEPLNRFSPFIAEHKNDKFLRIDVSPYLGGVVQSLNLESDISQINLYAITLSLLNPYWGYEQQVFFSKNTGDTVNVNNLAKWFGIKYLFLEDKLDPIEKYASDSANWQKVDPAGVWKFSTPTEIWSWTAQKPNILVIGNTQKQAFEPVFRTGANGGYNFDDGYLVQGKEKIDDYSLSELRKFSGLVLFGYSYSNQSKAFSLLDSYIKDGGNVFIDSGWQYVNRDWELAKAPEFLPVKDLKWSSTLAGEGSVVLENNELAKDINMAKFPPLKWNEQPWGVSIPTDGLREWAKPILTINGKPIMAVGTYGKGKVIWSGFNIFGHINTYKYEPEELKLFRDLITWFGKGDYSLDKTMSAKVAPERSYPDNVKFTFNETTDKQTVFYWRESYYSKWHATLLNDNKKSKVQIYKAGPGFMLMVLPPLKSGSVLILDFKPGNGTIVGRIISFITLILLILFVIGKLKINSTMEKHIAKLKSFGKSKLSQVKSNISMKEDEDDY